MFSIHQRCCLSHENEGNIPLVLAVKEKEDKCKTDEEDWKGRRIWRIYVR